MEKIRIFLFLCFLYCVQFVNASRPTECCKCDDKSTDVSKRCSNPGVCDREFGICLDYCQETRTFSGGVWSVTRDCSNETTCRNNWYHTVTTLGCIDNTRGEPGIGTTCYACCTSTSALSPFACRDNPDQHVFKFNITTLPTTPTTPSTTTTTPTTKPTTPKPTTTTPMPTTRTTTTSTTSTTTPLPTTSSTTMSTTTKMAVITGHCHVCDGVTCFGSGSTVCQAGETFCMNTVTTGTTGTITNLTKRCATEAECFYDGYVMTSTDSFCDAASTTGLFRGHGSCNFCCKSGPTGQSVCNAGPIPGLLYSGDTKAGSMCEVGIDGSYTRQTCSPSAPLCMNTIVVSNGYKITKKSCEPEILCYADWWNSTRHKSECNVDDSTKLTVHGPGTVCHFCCRSDDSNVCNAKDIPSGSQNYMKINGGWSEWLPWNGCTTGSCDGQQVRVRTCSHPFPSDKGEKCHGEYLHYGKCSDSVACSGSGSIVG